MRTSCFSKNLFTNHFLFLLFLEHSNRSFASVFKVSFCVVMTVNNNLRPK